MISTLPVAILATLMVLPITAANPAGAPAITQSQAKHYVTDFKAANPDGDGSLDQNEFSAACKNGLVTGASSSGAASGETGNKTAPAEKMAPKDSSKY